MVHKGTRRKFIKIEPRQSPDPRHARSIANVIWRISTLTALRWVIGPLGQNPGGCHPLAPCRPPPPPHPYSTSTLHSYTRTSAMAGPSYPHRSGGHWQRRCSLPPARWGDPMGIGLGARGPPSGRRSWGPPGLHRCQCRPPPWRRRPDAPVAQIHLTSS
jgi:hypothetical protein